MKLPATTPRFDPSGHDATGRAEEAAPLLGEARELFETMGAVLWLRRLDAVAPVATSSA